ncbi:hypothetical protein BL253_34935 [Pseudofrankia asymbiotica]|uniref:Uncharacterized protein n=1 Tax=Pseudofrankia asymbiotica TaxID=1834516 RepID=A0A1V2I0P5_9ACTN|nr:hypothetical protein BL253_34935 [Pseudofrankia asymbiotica]
MTTGFAEAEIAKLVATYAAASIPAQARSREEIARFFTDSDPGIQPCQRWRPTDNDPPTDAAVSCYGAIARRP